MAISTDDIWFEVQRRAVIYKSTTVMPDQSLLGFNGNPNSVDKDANSGEQLLYYAAQGSLYMDDNGNIYNKKSKPNTWNVIAGAATGSGGGYDGGDLEIQGDLSITGGLTADGPSAVFGEILLGANNNVITLGGDVDGDITPSIDNTYTLGNQDQKYKEIHVSTIFADNISVSGDTDIQVTESLHVLSRGAFVIDTPAAQEREYVSMQQDNFGGDAKYQDLDHSHAFVLPYDGYVKRIILRAGASVNDNVIIGVHTNNGLSPANGYSYSYFAQEPVQEISKKISGNNQPTVYNFNESASASTGETLGVSISADSAIDATSITIVLSLDESA